MEIIWNLGTPINNFSHDLHGGGNWCIHYICALIIHRRLLQEQCRESHRPHCQYVLTNSDEECGIQVHIVNLFQPFHPWRFKKQIVMTCAYFFGPWPPNVPVVQLGNVEYIFFYKMEFRIIFQCEFGHSYPGRVNKRIQITGIVLMQATGIITNQQP